MTLPSAPAHAGSWQFSGSGSGTAHAEDAYYGPWDLAPWIAPDPSNNSYTIPSYGYPIIQPGSYGPGATVSQNVNITVTITGKWIPDSSLPSDPAPTSVWLIESSSAEWEAKYIDRDGTHAGSSSGSNDLGDKPVPTIVNGVTVGSYVDSKNTPVTTPPAHWFVQKVNGNSFTLPLHTFTAKGSFTIPTSSSGGTVSFGARFDGYTLSVHAQPYNFRRIPGAGVIGKTPDGNPNGEIDWAYAYSSTDGNPGNLTTCTWHEHLTYPDGQVGTQAAPNKYYPPSPPFGYPASGTAWFPNPDFGTDKSLVPSPAGSAPEIDDFTFVPAFLKPYVYGTFSSTQVFEFNDSATGDKNVQIPGPDSGPFTIVRTVKYVDPTHYEYDVSKASASNTLSLPD